MTEYKLDPKNARIHPDRNREAVEKSLRELGAGRSIVVDRDGVVIGGNAVYEKAVELGLDMRVVHTTGDRLVVVVRDDLATDDPRRKALALADNQIALLAEWDEVLLEEILGELEEIDLDVMGFEESDEPIEEPIEPGELIDRAEELQKKWKVKRGQIWEIPGKAGIHRVMCGDSTDEGQHISLIDGTAIDAVVTDPPYGVGIDYESFADQLEDVEKLITHIMPLLLHYPRVALTPGIPAMWSYPRPTWLMAWIHPAPTGGCPWGFNGLNPILVYGDDPYLKAGLGRRLDHIVQVADREGVKGHPTPKPLKVWSWLVERLTIKEEQTVFDPFLGSGTTVVAAEQEGRVAFGMEIEPRYVSVTLERLSALGLKPVMCDG